MFAKTYLRISCFFFHYLGFWAHGSSQEDSDTKAIGVLLACLMNALLISSFLYFLDFPKDLLGLRHDKTFWDIFSTFGLGVAIWTLWGWLLMPLYEKKVLDPAREELKKREYERAGAFGRASYENDRRIEAELDEHVKKVLGDKAHLHKWKL